MHRFKTHTILNFNKTFPSFKQTCRRKNQYDAPLDTNPVALQQQLSKMKAGIEQLQQARRPNSYPYPLKLSGASGPLIEQSWTFCTFM